MPGTLGAFLADTDARGFESIMSKKWMLCLSCYDISLVVEVLFYEGNITAIKGKVGGWVYFTATEDAKQYSANYGDRCGGANGDT